MKYLLVLVALGAVVYSQRPTGTGGTGGTRVPPTATPCQICDYVVSQAEHHIRRGRVDKGELQAALLEECESLRRYYGHTAVNQCVDMVDANIQTILDDVNANKDVNTICQDIKQC